MALIDEARTQIGLSRKAMAINAGIQESVLSEALNGTRGNVAAQWLWAQGNDYLMVLLRLMQERRGLSAADEAEADAKRIGELVTLLVKSSRRAVSA